ncbi:hypothetical protein G4X40_18595 [Rhodococcus sp. D2-41]|uniref:phage portal protein family protein n=1 Tax=Speluncibacter jeojiensis TaxID=2710754 RepID=UPI00240ED2C9|nr:hypothetical protein [Rhodococcus sp. D2-41]MDG3012155.1 hypothetical protein [Rhodococcus sp. D2-41]
MPDITSVPKSEIGYAVAYPGDYWQLDAESTPELRWPMSSRVYEMMRRQDAQVTSVLRAVTLPVRRTQWRIDPNGARPEVAQMVAEDLRLPLLGEEPQLHATRSKGRFAWGDHLQLALLMIQYGHMFFEQVYRIDAAGHARLAKLAPRMPRTIASIRVARDGGLESIAQYPMGVAGDYGTTSPSSSVIPVSRLVAYVHDREGGNWIGNSLLRPAYKHWVIKDRLLRVQAQTIERNGMGVPVYQAGPSDSTEDIEAGRDMATSFRSGDASGAAVPWEAKLRLLGVEGNLPDATPAIRYHDEQIGRAVLAHFLNLGAQTGSWALGSTFADFFVLSLQTLAQQVADTANQHIVEDIVDINFGEDEIAPKIVFDEIGSRRDATAEAIKLLVDAGILFPDRMLEQSVRTQFGLPPKQDTTGTTP